MNNGWIKLHRKITEWEWYQDDSVFRVFIHLLLTANHEDKNWRGVLVRSGQNLVGRKKMAQQLRLGEQQVRTALNKLKSTNEITITTTTKYSLITILKWKDYQQLTNNVTNNQPTTNQQLTTNKNVIIKEDKKDTDTSPTINFEVFWEKYPKKVERKKAEERWNRLPHDVRLTIMNDIPRRALGRQWREGFIPNPTTYLNGERWNDVIDIPTIKSSGVLILKQ